MKEDLEMKGNDLKVIAIIWTRLPVAMQGTCPACV